MGEQESGRGSVNEMEVQVPRDPVPDQRIFIDGEPWVWDQESSRWLLEAASAHRIRPYRSSPAGGGGRGVPDGDPVRGS